MKKSLIDLRFDNRTLAETRGFEPPIPFRENLISSEAH